MNNSKLTNNQLRQTTAFLFTFFMVLFVSHKTLAQSNTLFGLGEKVLNITQSEKPDKILDLVSPNSDLDQKASILESFMTTKSALANITDLKNIKLFNVLKENDSLVYFILQNDKKYYIVKSLVDNDNTIAGDFMLMKTDVSEKLQKGEMVYKTKCYSCHGLKGKGGMGPNLTDEYCKFDVKTDEDLYDIIANGKKGTMMIAFKNYLSKEEINNVIIYLKAIKGIKIANGKPKEGDKKDPHLKLFNK